MSIKVVKKTHVVWPVTVNIPEDGGKAVEHNFFVKFKRLGEAEFNKLASQSQTKLLAATMDSAGETEDSLTKLNDKSRDELLESSNYRVGIYQAYLSMDAGVVSKN